MKDDSWVEWHGGECPVPAGTRVDLKFRGGLIANGGELAYDFAWDHTGLGADIMRYRITKPAEPPKPDTSAEENRLWHGYAGKAMQGFLARDEIFVDMRADLDAFATGAADMADAMLTEARKRGRV